MINSEISPANSARIRSVDFLRGAIMVLMAIDHVRVYSGMPSGGADPAIFFTRWVTHFCVSGFVFFAGAAAFLYGHKINNPNKLSRYLFTRGLLLVILELTLIRFCWSFNLDFKTFMLAGVIWMLGWCMVLLSGIIRLSFRAVWISGLVIIAAQQLFGLIPASWTWWDFLYPRSEEGPGWIHVLYVLVPWIGVMMAGYGFGKLLIFEPDRRNKLCLQIGLSAIGLFLVAGSIIAASGHKNNLPFILRLLSQQKYPPSQLFLLMTLGPLITLVPLAEKAQGVLARVLNTFGRVPLFYYILHIALIHLLALGLNGILYGSGHQEWYNTAPFTNVPEDYRWGLPLLYAIFITAEVVLYFACRQYSVYKAKHPEKLWLKYL
ncbi:DUF1624 domain-containing protein [Mucilaginibacter ginsenosidivorax]|uniref:DUF1624 domain-containing protein n=1 Tax=Mucilaginibacter ginsenosidivorax TaxID=862126 RepID=A0A5B8VYV1_9SPHI|nr:heparan-alpha-glucosaminide N-acetyltransferase domain-containing protein [Mucilaginibacter ginsenosidivorax]QEC76810.1 DUF1624 domain-containing protein [Mucilaginibacter ginsenosidivorax]